MRGWPALQVKALIVGLGSIGRRHLANLKELVPGCAVTVWHQKPGHLEDVREGVDVIQRVTDLTGALASRPDFAVVTNPTSMHVDTALHLAEEGVHLLIEKPLSDRLDNVDRLLESCRSRGLSLLVGYNYRFSESLRRMREAIVEGCVGRVLFVRAEVGQYLPDWRPDTDYRKSVTARAELGGGVLLELSHEIDYVRWLMGDVIEVSARSAHLSDLETDVEDVAEIMLVFRGGAMASIHLNMIQRPPSRSCRVIGSNGTLLWDGLTQQLRLYTSDSGEWTELCPADSHSRNAMYLAELRHFLDCVYGDADPIVPGEDARRVLEIVLAAKQSSRERRVVSV